MSEESRDPGYIRLVLTNEGGDPPPRTFHRKDLVGVSIRTALARVRREQRAQGLVAYPPYKLNGAKVSSNSTRRLKAGDKLTIDPIPTA